MRFTPRLVLTTREPLAAHLGGCSPRSGRCRGLRPRGTGAHREWAAKSLGDYLHPSPKCSSYRGAPGRHAGGRGGQEWFRGLKLDPQAPGCVRGRRAPTEGGNRARRHHHRGCGSSLGIAAEQGLLLGLSQARLSGLGTFTLDLLGQRAASAARSSRRRRTSSEGPYRASSSSSTSVVSDAATAGLQAAAVS